MPPDVKLVSFDCYGTVIDALGGAGAFLYCLARGCGEDCPPPGPELAARFLVLLEVCVRREFRSFEPVLKAGLHALAAERNWRLEPIDGESLVQSMGSWQPYSEARPALRVLQAQGIRTALVANGNSRIMAHTLRQLDLGFDAVVLSDDCGSYKRSPQLLRTLIYEIPVEPPHVLHVSGNSSDDIAAAHQLGYKTAWINRTGTERSTEADPDYEWRSLSDVAELTRPSH